MEKVTGMRAVLIMNPASGMSVMAAGAGTAEKHEEVILAALRTHGIEAELRYTTPEDLGERLATQAAAEQADVVIAAGGDGTIHKVAAGLIGSQSALGIIALGTMNNLAHSLHIPETIEEACAAVATGETIAIDAGKINDQCFFEVAGIGLEAALFPSAEEVKKAGVRSTLHGIISGLLISLAYKPAKLRISIDEQGHHPYYALQVTICNSRYYGPQFELVPDALMDDGLLDVVIFKNFSKLEYMRHVISIVLGKRAYQPKALHHRVKSLRINADHPVEIQADGLPHGYTPATVTVLPGALRVRVPVRAQLAFTPAAGQRSAERNSTSLIEQTSSDASKEKHPVNVR
jgi:diacylglycerol kinase (ATP)